MESLFEAFENLEDIDDLMLSASINDVEKIKAFKEGDDVAIEYQKIIDPLARTEDELEGNYLGKKILQCCVCHSLLYKDEEDIRFNEDETLANEGEECPTCFSTEGFKVVGEVTPLKDDTLYTEDDEQFELARDVKNILEKFYRKSNEVDFEPLFKLETNGTLDLEKVREKLLEEPKLIKGELLGVLDIIEKGGTNIAEPESVKEVVKKVSELIPEEEEEVKDSIEIETTGEAGFKAAEKAMDTFENETKLEESTERDDIDADADDKKERIRKALKRRLDDADSLRGERRKSAKAKFRKAQDDIDADRDDKLERKGLRENTEDVTDQVIIKVGEPGYLTKKRELEEKGYKRLWSGEGKICMAKPKEVKEECKESVTPRDDIDAEADNKKELAKKRFMRAKDDADADKDYRLKKAGLKEPRKLREEKEPEFYVFEEEDNDFNTVQDWYWDNDGFNGKDGGYGLLIMGNKNYETMLYIGGNDEQDIKWAFEYSKNDEEFVEKLKEITGKDYEIGIIRGYSPSEWQNIYYPVNEFDDETIEQIEDVYFGKYRTYFDTYEEVGDYVVFDSSKKSPKEQLSAQSGYPVEKIKIRKITGYHSVPDYVEESCKTQRKRKLRVKELQESDKPAATSIEDAQKWVDYDMKKYGKISGRTNRLVRKAGFQIVKDTYGDYEVIAGDYEKPEEEVRGLKEDKEIDKQKDNIRKFIRDGHPYSTKKGETSYFFPSKIEELKNISKEEYIDIAKRYKGNNSYAVIQYYKQGNDNNYILWVKSYEDAKKYGEEMSLGVNLDYIYKNGIVTFIDLTTGNDITKDVYYDEIMESDYWYDPYYTDYVFDDFEVAEQKAKELGIKNIFYTDLSNWCQVVWLKDGHPTVMFKKNGKLKDVAPEFVKRRMNRGTKEESLKEDRYKDAKHYVEYKNGEEFDNGFFTNDEYNKLKKASKIKILRHKIGNEETNKWEDVPEEVFITKDEIDKMSIPAALSLLNTTNRKERTGIPNNQLKLKEDTVKQGNYWVNKGEEGTHGKFKTKKAADEQRKAMFARAGKNRKFGEKLDQDEEYDWRRTVEKSYNLEDGELDGKTVREAEEICGEEKGGLDRFLYDYEGKFVGDKKDLAEGFNKVNIETDDYKMDMTSDENGKVVVTTEPLKKEEFEGNAETITPLTDEESEELTKVATEEPEEVEVDFDEIDEESFNEISESYMKRVYENINSFKITKATSNDTELKLEGVINFKSGKKAKTNFVFESKEMDKKNGRLKFVGENKQFAKGRKSFTLNCSVKDNKLVTESLNYNYRGKDAKTGLTKKLYGTVKK